MDLREIRQEIDVIDENIVRLFVRRMQAAEEVAESKRKSGSPVTNPAREREILAKVARQAGPDLENEARLLFTTLMAISRGRQRAELSGEEAFVRQVEQMVAATPERFPTTASVACPGAEGSYSQQAACNLVQIPRLLYFKTFEDVFAAVEKGMCDYGVVPIENSTVGSVTAVYDLMMHGTFRIVKALKLRIRHVLLAPKGTRLGDVREVVSHPYALAQCSRFLRGNPDIHATPATNTAVAAAAAARSGRTDLAVIGSRDCAELYGLDVLSDEISDNTSNYTRFICFSSKEQIFPDAHRISILLCLSHRPGALSDVLVKFAAIGVNLTKLESRPVPGSDFEFRFVLDFDASLRDPKVVKLLSGLSSDPDVEQFVFLGAYPEK